MALTETLKAVSDPVRRQILQLLQTRSMPAGEIADQFAITQAAISRHLAVLKKAGLVRTYRQGQFIWYELNTTVLDEVIVWACNLQENKGETHDTKENPAHLADPS